MSNPVPPEHLATVEALGLDMTTLLSMQLSPLESGRIVLSLHRLLTAEEEQVLTLIYLKPEKVGIYQ